MITKEGHEQMWLDLSSSSNSNASPNRLSLHIGCAWALSGVTSSKNMPNCLEVVGRLCCTSSTTRPCKTSSFKALVRCGPMDSPAALPASIDATTSITVVQDARLHEDSATIAAENLATALFYNSHCCPDEAVMASAGARVLVALRQQAICRCTKQDWLTRIPRKRYTSSRVLTLLRCLSSLVRVQTVFRSQYLRVNCDLHYGIGFTPLQKGRTELEFGSFATCGSLSNQLHFRAQGPSPWLCRS